MIFRETPLNGAFVVELEPIGDSRGSFVRTWCAREFAAHGIGMDIVQCNNSFNAMKGTLRGMHFQKTPHQEAKVVRCMQGGIYDVIIDLRPDSPTFKRWFGVTLSGEKPLCLYVPRDFAHGFLTLTDNAEVSYLMSEYYYPEWNTGVRWNDPAFDIKWPTTENLIISEKDSSYRDFTA
jgi:dTDP-4-dehydrorhamnose 3,5-epimerase